MKVLCFTTSTYKYSTKQNSYFGGGWIDSLVSLLEKNETVELALSFFHDKKDNKKVETGSMVYYPVYKAPRSKNRFKTIIGDWLGKIEEDDEVSDDLIKVINDFGPDVIQIFGTEGIYACVQKYTNVPVLVHLQGLLNPYYNAYYPPSQSKWNFIFDTTYLIDNVLGKGPSFTGKRIKNMAKRELQNFKSLRYASGRTKWDKMVAEINNPAIKYFHLEEVLRPIFYEKQKSLEVSQKGSKINIVSTISPTIYKGVDVIYRTAKLLLTQTDVQFNWKIIGLEKNNPLVRHYEKSLDIFHKDVNIEFVGIKKAEEFIAELLNSNIYVHPSYIDNSPNSVCEAQMLGLPVIACNVGGLSTIIDHGKTGVLVPANGIHEIVDNLMQYYNEPEDFHEMGQAARKTAIIRHDRRNILNNLLSVYETISQEN